MSADRILGISPSALRSLSDSLRKGRLRSAWTWAVAIPLLAGCGYWAFAPIPTARAASIAMERPASAPAVAEDTFDLRAFSTARLWTAPAPAVPSAQDPGASPGSGSPLRLQLIGITSEGTALVACLYDPDADRILLLRGGDRLGAHTVERVTDREVAFHGESGDVRVTLARTER